MKKNYLLGVLGVLLIVGIGISFAYFVSGVLFSGEGSGVTLEPGDMIKVSYDAGNGSLNTEGMIPGDSTSKDFSVTVTPTETEKEATYGIFLNITENTFVKCDDTNYNDLTNACTRDAQELTYTIKDKDSGTTLKTGDLTGVTGKIKLLTETKTVDIETTFNYTITITFVDTGADQNHNQNKTFNGNIEVEFSGPSAKDYILANKTISDERSGAITGVLTEDTTGTVYRVADDDGNSYVFAGTPTDNWVSFAGFYWRIIRINGDGSIRMIYNGTSTAATGEGTMINSSQAFNTNYNDNAYVGYMYGSTGANSYAATHTNTNNSSIKTVVDNWYRDNLLQYAQYISTEAGFCGDRKVYTGASWSGYGTLGYGTNATTYEPTSRFLQWSSGSSSWRTSQNPTLKCSQSNDLYTVSGSSKGNHALTYPIGLITADEVVLAGGFGGSNNTSYYLYNNAYYWTMSPYRYGGTAGVFYVTSNGRLYNDWVYGTNGVRPVINLSANVTISAGNGTSETPYVVS